MRIRKSFLWAAFWGSLGCASAKPYVPPPPPPPQGSLLFCVNEHEEAITDLAPTFAKMDVKKTQEADECRRALMAIGVVGRPCLEREQDCETPHYIDGKTVDTPDSPYDQVVLFSTLAHGSLSVHTRTTEQVVSAGGAQGMGGGGRRGGGGGPRSKTVKKVENINSAETGYTGEMYLFEPHSGQLRRGKTFSDIKAETLQDSVLAMLGRS